MSTSPAETATVGDALVARLRDWGVRRVFGYSGDGINGVLEAVRRTAGAVEFVQARHEETAAFMAVADAKYGGGVGVVLATQGPGAVHLLNGLYDALLDGVPVVAIVGQQHRSALGSDYMQEVDLSQLFSDVAASYRVAAVTAEQVPLVIDRAFRTALADAAPTVVIVPSDVQAAPASDRPHEHAVVHTAAIAERPVVRAPEERIRAAAELLSEARRPVILAGAGVAGSGDALAALADRLGAGVVTSLLGKPHVDETLPFAAGTMGHLGTTASAELLAECDALLIVGSNTPWTEFYPHPDQARAVQIDIDPRAIGNRYPVEIGLVSAAGPALEALLAHVAPRGDSGWRQRVREAVQRWRAITAARAEVRMQNLNPEAAIRALQPHLVAGTRVALDVGSVVYWYARQLVVPPGVPVHFSSTLASMGCGLPYGLAAKLQAPDEPVVVLSGDGGFQMTGLAELATIAARWRDWADPRFVIAILDNGDLAEVSWEQRENEDPRFSESQELPRVPYADYARLLGLDGMHVTGAEQLAEAWDRAFRADRPFVLQLFTDPAAPMLPPGGEGVGQMRAALRKEVEEAEGAQAIRAAELLERYSRIEEEAFPASPAGASASGG